jgi:hypothetical protein
VTRLHSEAASYGRGYRGPVGRRSSLRGSLKEPASHFRLCEFGGVDRSSFHDGKNLPLTPATPSQYFFRMESTRCDDSRWPIVRITTPAYTLDEGAFLRYLDRLTSYHERGEVFGFLFDVRKSPPMPADQRRMIAERIELDAERYGRRCPCALVVSSSMQRGVIKVIMWLLREPHPIAVFTSMDTAEAWLRDTWALRPRTTPPSVP